MYLDIFKNYFANTQEENFYIITGSTEATITFNQKNESAFTAQVGQDANQVWKSPMGITTMLKAGDNVRDYASFWKSVKIRFYNPSTGQSKETYANYLTSNSNTQTITTNRNSENHFAQVPRMERPRSKFDRSHQLLTTINEGDLVPIYCDEVLPGDTAQIHLNGLIRMSAYLSYHG